MGRENVIELNGKRYDAITGAYLGESRTKPVPATSAPASRHGKVLDGVVRSSSRPTPNQPADQPQTPKHHTNPTATAAKRQDHTPKHAKHRRPEQAKTLMRHAVKKPSPSLKPAIKPQAPVEIAAAPIKGLMPKRSAASVDPVKLQRARQVQRHQQIQRFSRTAASTTAHYATPPTRLAHHQPVTNHRASTTRQQATRPTDIFEAAIARANNHEQLTPKHVRQRQQRRRTARLVVVVATLLIVGGFVTWLQWPHIELRTASFQAGFQASMPSHQLAGYERSTIRHEHGQVVMSFHSGDSHYRITQQSSNWNSRTLLDSAVAGASTEEPRVIESKGRIIYLYGNNASWVDGGVRYDITGNAPLTAEDIRAIVDSM